MREYEAAAKVATAETWSFKMKDPSLKEGVREIHLYIPDEDDFAVAMADVVGRDVPEVVQLGATVNFFFDLVVEEKDQQYLWKRLKNRKDGFKMKSIQKIFEDMMEDVSGHPTDVSSGSNGQPQETTPSSSPATVTSI